MYPRPAPPGPGAVQVHTNGAVGTSRCAMNVRVRDKIDVVNPQTELQHALLEVCLELASRVTGRRRHHICRFR